DGADQARFNYSPPLFWTAGPSGTKSYALLMYGPNGYAYWNVYNLPTTERYLLEDAGALGYEELSNGGRQGNNDFEKLGYMGPFANPGETNDYVYTVYALDTAEIDSSYLDYGYAPAAWVIQDALAGHVLGFGMLTGTYSEPAPVRDEGWNLTVQTSGDGTVTWMPSAGEETELITLTATPKAGSVFVGWTDDLGGFNTNRIRVVSTASNMVLTANFCSVVDFANEGAAALAAFFRGANAGADVPSLDRSKVAAAATYFKLASGAAPSNYANRICNAVTMLLNLINDPAVRSQAAKYGFDMDNLLTPTVDFPTTGVPPVNDSVDLLASAVLPAITNALAELNTVPTNWNGVVQLWPEEMTDLGEPLWIDMGDVAAMKAACKGFRAFIELLQAYSLNVDFERWRGPLSNAVKTITLDGASNDWAGVPLALLDADRTVTQKFFVAKDRDNSGTTNIALLMSSTLPYASAASFWLDFTLQVKNGSTGSTDEVYVQVWGGNGQILDLALTSYAEGNGDRWVSSGSIADYAVMSDGVLEIKLPLAGLGATSVIALEGVDGEVCDEVGMYRNFEAWMPTAVPLTTLRANNPEFLSRVRNAPSLAKVKTDLLAALADYLAADT
ncbi:MAG: YbhB/YbcL family Raf kinase inhibitor-like protein, partial [Kiritimatiellia bacterium]